MKPWASPKWCWLRKQRYSTKVACSINLHAIVIGSHNWGVKKYWTAVFSDLGIALSSRLISFLILAKLKGRRFPRRSIIRRLLQSKEERTSKILARRSFCMRTGQQSISMVSASTLVVGRSWRAKKKRRARKGKNQEQKEPRGQHVDAVQPGRNNKGRDCSILSSSFPLIPSMASWAIFLYWVYATQLLVYSYWSPLLLLFQKY